MQNNMQKLSMDEVEQVAGGRVIVSTGADGGAGRVIVSTVVGDGKLPPLGGDSVDW